MHIEREVWLVDGGRDLRRLELASAGLLAENAPRARDLASIERLQLELRQAAKLRVVGQLSVEVDLGELPRVQCYPGELSQVLQSLLVNAAQAVVERFGSSNRRGWIHVTTKTVGDVLVITVADSEAGIPAEHHARVFEPFFTTKPQGRGSGQALAIAQAIVVNEYGGSLTFESAAGSGSTVRLEIPISTSRPSVNSPTKAA